MKTVTLEEEFARHPECPIENFHCVKEWLKSQPHLPQISDRKIFQFLFSCFYDVEKTKRCIEVFYEIKTNAPEFYIDRDITRPEMQTATGIARTCTLPVLTPKRYRITYQGFSTSDTTNFVFTDCAKLFLMAYDAALYTQGTAMGHIILFDYKNVKFSHTMKCSISAWKKVIRLTQEGLPVRKKTMHILNTNYFVYKFAQMLKPFINPHVFQTIHLHREGDMDEVYKFIPRECLPKEFGGDLESIDVYTKRWEEEMALLREFFKEDDALIIDKSRVPQ